MEDCAPSNPAFVFTILSHRRKYYLTELLPYLGERFCERFAAAWKTAFAFMKFSTTEAYFKAIRRALTAICLRGIREPSSPEGRIFEGFRDNPTYVPSGKDFGQVIINLQGVILDLSDRSYVDSDKPRSRNNQIESLRLAIRSLAHQGMFPPDIEPTGSLEERGTSVPKCLATLSFEAGKLNVRGLTSDEAIRAFVQRNRDMLYEMKRLFWDDLLDNERKFDEGQKLLSLPGLPTVSEIERALSLWTIPEIQRGLAFADYTERQRWAIALRIEQLHLNDVKVKFGDKKRRAYTHLYFTHEQVQPYLEPTSRCLTAVFHILLIETGANVQPLEDLPFKVYRGRARHGKRQLALTKNRANGKPVPAPIAEERVYIEVKSVDDLSPVAVAIRIWKKLSAPLRALTGPTQELLWVWRKAAGTRTICTHNPMVNHEPWYNFLRRVEHNHLLGGVAITRQAIRKAVANSKASTGDFDFIIQNAIFAHVNWTTTFGYLSEGAVRAFLSGRIREFLDAWEATSVINIENAAKMLGVHEIELVRRQRLGLENGLSFAALVDEDETPQDNPDGLLAEEAKNFVVTDRSLTVLDLARRALWGQFENLVHSNPERFLRIWVPWLAIVEGYIERLEASRFRVRLKRVRDKISAQLSSGALTLPILW